ncbi:MAG: 16S rRNA (cytidine(1402)-2'-O)-methyltransferase [Chthonomonas sp.]|nr:16S rRNA (cytidine(1402)-2'-O)-methyltransferase [Chthonomonas sp.]
MAGRLVLVATPIGNLGDLSPRVAAALQEADFWIVEDSRVSGRLGVHLGVKKPMVVVNDHVRPGQIQAIVQRLESGECAALMSDGGAPCISDPGSLVVDAAAEAGIDIDAIPGPSAPITALMLSGFFAQRFAFLGFLGRKEGDMRKELKAFAESPLTLVLFESPFRIDTLLRAAGEALGPRRYAITRELTKMHQQVVRGVLPVSPPDGEMPRKGEFTVVFEGLRRADKRKTQDSAAENPFEAS